MTKNKNSKFEVMFLSALLMLFLCGCVGQGHGKLTKPLVEESEANYRGMKAVSAYDTAKQLFPHIQPVDYSTAVKGL